jgi:hypothetical protein
MPVFCNSNTLSPRWLIISARMVTNPRPGREDESRLPSILERAVKVSPASTGFFHLT